MPNKNKKQANASTPSEDDYCSEDLDEVTDRQIVDNNGIKIRRLNTEKADGKKA